MKTLLFSVDVESDLHTGKFKGIKNGLKKILDIVKEFDVPTTLFVSPDCLDKSNIFLKFIDYGHEIALHGETYERFDKLSFMEKKSFVEASIETFHSILGVKPLGFRAPQHRIDAQMLRILENYEFKYDSSVSPRNIILPKHFFAPTSPYYPSRTNIFRKGESKILEIPPSSIFIPFVAMSLRLFNMWQMKRLFDALYLSRNIVSFYVHSWDFIELPESKVYKFCPINKFVRKLHDLFEYILKTNIKPLTYLQLVNMVDKYV
jgi:hypothetical protein